MKIVRNETANVESHMNNLLLDKDVDDVIVRAVNGSHRDFEVLVRRYYGMVMRLAWRFVGDGAIAKDIVQDTFIKAWLSLKKYDGKYSFSTWLYRIATNVSVDYIKKEKRYDKISISEHNICESLNKLSEINDDISDCEMESVVRMLSGHLSETQRVVFTLRVIEGLDVDEVMRITGYSEKKIRNNLYVAKSKIKDMLQKWM